MQTALQPQQNKRTDFLPDLASTEIKQLQEDTANDLELPVFFSDTLKNGSKAPELAIIPAGKYEMGSTEDEFGHSTEEYPQHYSHIQKPFASSAARKKRLFDEMDTNLGFRIIRDI